MKPTICIGLALSILLMSSKSYGHDKTPVLEGRFVLEGPYVGQKLPGLTPKVFAPSERSTEHRDHSGFFSPDMKEFYFTRRNN